MEYYVKRKSNNFLEHHGIKGQKWGIRRYQFPDGSLTPEGRERYGYNYETGEYNKKLYMEDQDRQKAKEYSKIESEQRKKEKAQEKKEKAQEKKEKRAEQEAKRTEKENKKAAKKVEELRRQNALKMLDADGKPLTNKKLRKLSTAELEAVVNRMALEKKYSDIKLDNVSKGRQNTEKLLTNTAKVIGLGTAGVKLAKDVYESPVAKLAYNKVKKKLINKSKWNAMLII